MGGSTCSLYRENADSNRSGVDEKETADLVWCDVGISRVFYSDAGRRGNSEFCEVDFAQRGSAASLWNAEQ